MGGAPSLPSVGYTWNSMGWDMRENTPKLGSVRHAPCPENPIKPLLSVYVEMEASLAFVCQNTAEMHLIKCTPKALKPRLFLPPNLPHPDL